MTEHKQDDLKPLANCEVKNTRRNKTTADPCAGPKSSLAKAFQEEPALCADLDLLSSLTADLVGALLDTVLDLLAMVGELLQLGNLGAAVLSLLVGDLYPARKRPWLTLCVGRAWVDCRGRPVGGSWGAGAVV